MVTLARTKSPTFGYIRRVACTAAAAAAARRAVVTGGVGTSPHLSHVRVLFTLQREGVLARARRVVLGDTVLIRIPGVPDMFLYCRGLRHRGETSTDRRGVRPLGLRVRNFC